MTKKIPAGLPATKQVPRAERGKSQPPTPKNDGRQFVRPFNHAFEIEGLAELRTRARRSGEFAGYKPTQWAGDDGRWKRHWNTEADGPPAFARVSVYRRGDRRPICAIASFWESAEWFQTDDGPAIAPWWMQFGRTLLAAVAEAAALDQAFPERFNPTMTRIA